MLVQNIVVPVVTLDTEGGGTETHLISLSAHKPT